MISPKKSSTASKLLANNDPSPHEFAKYLPWICSKYVEVEHNVNVIIVYTKETASIRSLNMRSRSRINKTPHPAFHSEETEMEIKSRYLNYPVVKREPVNITATYDRYNKLYKVEFEKKKPVPLPVLRLFLFVAEYHPKLHYLIMRCGIDQQTIHMMSKYLPTSNITHLHLDDTFIPEANYYTLLGDGCKLIEISLARCNINDVAVSLIAEKLAYPNGASRVLTILNLSSNKITDIGALDIATAMRRNRKLIYLNLAGNQLTDDGASEILNSLVPFPLTDSENKQRMKDHVPYMMKKLIYFKELRKRLDIENERERRRTLRRSIKKLTAEKKNTAEKKMSPVQKSSAEKKRSPEKTHSAEKKLLGEKKLAAEKKLLAKQKLSAEKTGSAEKRRASLVPNEEDVEKNLMRPFRSKDLFITDNTLWSYGNNVLCYINLAYNDLTSLTVTKIREVLKKQQKYLRDPKGLMRVRLEGNRMPFNSKEMKEVQRMIEAQRFLLRSRSPSTILKCSSDLLRKL